MYKRTMFEYISARTYRPVLIRLQIPRMFNCKKINIPIYLPICLYTYIYLYLFINIFIYLFLLDHFYLNLFRICSKVFWSFQIIVNLKKMSVSKLWHNKLNLILKYKYKFSGFNSLPVLLLNKKQILLVEEGGWVEGWTTKQEEPFLLIFLHKTTSLYLPFDWMQS